MASKASKGLAAVEVSSSTLFHGLPKQGEIQKVSDRRKRAVSEMSCLLVLTIVFCNEAEAMSTAIFVREGVAKGEATNPQPFPHYAMKSDPSDQRLFHYTGYPLTS